MRSPMQITVCSDTDLSTSSKSYISFGRRFPTMTPRSTVPIRSVEEACDVALDRVLERREARVIPRPVQVFDRGLREILVAVPDRRRHLDKFDVGAATER